MAVQYMGVLGQGRFGNAGCARHLNAGGQQGGAQVMGGKAFWIGHGQALPTALKPRSSCSRKISTVSKAMCGSAWKTPLPKHNTACWLPIAT